MGVKYKQGFVPLCAYTEIDFAGGIRERKKKKPSAFLDLLF